jgi:type I restriction enzyme S subunit
LFVDQVKQEIHGGVNQNVHVENIKNVMFFQPKIDEQVRISEYLSKHTGNLDQKIRLVKQKIQLLKEYRQALISSVVTGKLRVTEEVS